MQFQQI